MRLIPKRRMLTGTQVARLLEREYDEARAVLSLVEAGDLTLSRRQIMRAEAIVSGCEEARLTPERPWWDEDVPRRHPAQRDAARATIVAAEQRLHTRGGQS